MKSLTALLLLLLCLGASAQTNSKQKAKGAVTKFVGKWKGEEKCADVSAPVALLFVVADSANRVLLSGIYSVQGNVIGIVKGDTIEIPNQEAVDPNFTNLYMEGKLGFGTNPFSLSGNIVVINNQKRDECTVKYYK
jgi:hypothetical protein